MIPSLRRAFLALVILTLLAGNGISTSNATGLSDYCVGTVELEFLNLINDYRGRNGVGQLSVSVTLGAAAEHHAIDMATTNTLSHTLSDGTDWLTNIVNHGYPYGYRTENIAWGYASAQNVFDAWKASAAHNSNMLNSGFGAIGIQRVYNSSAPYRYYWVTTFGSQLDAPATSCGGQAAPTPTAPAVTATATSVAPTATSVAPTATAVAPTSIPVAPTATASATMPDAPASLTGASKPKFNQLTWSDRASNEAGYRVYRSADNGASWQVVATNLPADTTRFQDRSSRASGRTYLYVVAAYNGAGEAKSNVASVVNK